MSVSAKLDTLDKKLKEKNQELGQTTEEEQAEIKGDIQKFTVNREQLQKKREILEEKLHDGRLLSESEERRYVEYITCIILFILGLQMPDLICLSVGFKFQTQFVLC